MKMGLTHQENKITSPLERAGVRLKICGQKHNIEEVAKLQPDYLGFIFWEPSSRYFEGVIPKLPEGVKKIGVFVDEAIEKVVELVNKHQLDGVQFHGKESPEYCHNLNKSLQSVQAQTTTNKISTTLYPTKFEIIKVFAVKDAFDFSVLAPYEKVCDYFLFDTKGKLPGGNGYTFDWKVLKNYPSTKPYFLSGGIGLDQIEEILSFLSTEESKYCYAIDVNSGFEEKPGLKNIENLIKFQTNLKLKTYN